MSHGLPTKFSAYSNSEHTGVSGIGFPACSWMDCLTGDLLRYCSVPSFCSRFFLATCSAAAVGSAAKPLIRIQSVCDKMAELQSLCKQASIGLPLSHVIAGKGLYEPLPQVSDCAVGQNIDLCLGFGMATGGGQGEGKPATNAETKNVGCLEAGAP